MMVEKFKNKYIIPVANCVLVKGSKRTAVCDLQRQDLKIVPNDIYEIVHLYGEKTVGEIYEVYGSENKETLDEYFQFLLSNEFVFLSDYQEDLERFGKLPNDCYCPNAIQNAIIDIDSLTIADCEKLMKNLKQLGCQHIQFRAFLNFDCDWILKLAEFSEQSELQSLEFIVPFKVSSEDIDYKKIFISCQRIASITIHSAPFEKEETFINGLSVLKYSTKELSGHKDCGCVHPSFFSLTTPMYIESQHHNTCLNRKISIDTEGNIKNCPSMAESFGNIKDTTLKEAIEKPGFKKYWNVTKDEIAVCKDCEFRHICTDCRAYLENPEDVYSKPLKCGYNPYTCEWEEWSTHPLKLKAIEYYGMQELIKRLTRN